MMNKLIVIIILSIINCAEFKSPRQYGIEQQLHAPCCWGGVIAEHDSPMAEAIKSIISVLIMDDFKFEDANIALLKTYDNQNIIDYSKKYLNNNMTDDDIINLFVGIHGEKIRALPENIGLGWITWKLPTFILFSSLIISSLVVRKFRSNTKNETQQINEKGFKKVDDAMKKMGI